jgi:hypothetical protein
VIDGRADRDGTELRRWSQPDVTSRLGSRLGLLWTCVVIVEWCLHRFGGFWWIWLVELVASC